MENVNQQMSQKTSQTEQTIQATPQVQVQPQVQPQPTVGVPKPETTEERLRRKLMTIVTNLFSLSNELALELATVDCDKWKECRVCMKAREIIKELKKMIQIQRELSQTSR